MGKVVLYIAASMDSYIAKPDGNVDWLNDHDFMIEGEDFGYKKLYDSIGTTLMGMGTYQEVLGFDLPFPYPDKTNYVFTKQNLAGDENVTFVSSDIPNFINSLKEKEKKDIWLVGGGKINTLFMKYSLIDEIILTIMPIILTDGIPLFSKGSVARKFTLQDTITFSSGVVQLFYQAKEG